MGGRRTYTQREIEMIFRLKYLINEKKFTAFIGRGLFFRLFRFAGVIRLLPSPLLQTGAAGETSGIAEIIADT